MTRAPPWIHTMTGRGACWWLSGEYTFKKRQSSWPSTSQSGSYQSDFVGQIIVDSFDTSQSPSSWRYGLGAKNLQYINQSKKKSEYLHFIPLVPCWWFSIANALVGGILTSRRGQPIRALRRRQHLHHQHDNLNLTWKHAPDSRQATGPCSCAATSRRKRRRGSILSLTGLRFKDKSESSLWPGSVTTFVASCSDLFIYCK